MSIREIKPKRNKFGTIISPFVVGPRALDDSANLESMNTISAFVAIHITDTAFRSQAHNRDGIFYVYQKTGPKLKAAIGHYISQVRGDQLVAFINPSTRLFEDATRIYQYADANRMERAYGFYVGNPANPAVVGFSAAIIPHVFQAVPDQMEMSGDWLLWLHKWAPKAMMSHRYFDASGLLSIADVEVKPASSYEILPDPVPAPKAPEPVVVEVVAEPVKPEPAKRKPGRPKKKA